MPVSKILNMHIWLSYYQIPHKHTILFRVFNCENNNKIVIDLAKNVFGTSHASFINKKLKTRQYWKFTLIIYKIDKKKTKKKRLKLYKP